MYTQTLSVLANAARESAAGGDGVTGVRSISPVLHAGIALVLHGLRSGCLWVCDTEAALLLAVLDEGEDAD